MPETTVKMRKIPLYSACCRQSVLGDAARQSLYCHGCKKTIRSFAGRKRASALAAIQFVRSHCRVEAMLCGEVIAYARDVPNLVWKDGMYRKEGRSKYKYFVQGSSLVSAIGLNPCQTEGGVKSLAAADLAMPKVVGTGS